MATVNLGRIKPVFRGAYSGSTAYVVDDIVTHGNETYICIQAHGAGTQAVTQTAYWTKLAAKGTDGTDVGTTITTQGDILYRDGSGLQRLAKGTAGQVLKMNSSANAPEWGTDQGGKIGQVITFTHQYANDVTSTSFQDVLSASGTTWEPTITPTATSSKILILNSVPVRNHRTNGNESRNHLKLFTKIGSASYAELDHYYEIGVYNYAGNGMIVATNYNATILHSPNTTDAVKYKIQIRTEDSSSHISTNWGGSNGSNSHTNRMTLLEVLA